MTPHGIYLARLAASERAAIASQCRWENRHQNILLNAIGEMVFQVQANRDFIRQLELYEAKEPE